MRRYPTPRSHAIFDMILSRLEMDWILTIGMSVFLAIAALLSLIAGIAIWPTVLELRGAASALGTVCGRICTLGLIALLVCIVISLALVLWQRQEFRAGRILILNLSILWLVASAILIAQYGVIVPMLQDSFMATLLWVIISFFIGYMLAVLPAVIVTLLIAIAHKLLDMLLPL